MGSSSDPTVFWVLSGLALGVFSAMVWPAFDRRRWRAAFDLSPTGVLWGAIGLYLLLRFAPWIELVPVIVVAVMVHEYGHVLAFRLAGHPAPVFRLAPFGGVAMSSQAPRSQAEIAYVALMGPGFSIVLLVAALMAAVALHGAEPAAALYAFRSAQIIALLNGFNLLPFFPLDGGRALRAIATTIGPGVAQGFGLLMAVALLGVAAMTRSWLLLAFGVFGLIGAARAGRTDRNVTPMPPATALVALGAYLLLLAVFLFTVRPDLLFLARQALA